MLRDLPENPRHHSLPDREAERCRRLAEALTDKRTVDILQELARDYDRRAGRVAG
ncbi:MAG: hypothetical protein AB7O91_03225 [Sphingomonas sp.]